jgi:dephospho-CoA kinase
MYVLGIVGGVASGKSAVANCLAARGAEVLDADAVGHDVLRMPEVVAALRQRWGDAVVGPDGQIVRRAVAERVFGDSSQARQEREFLNSVTHPRIRDELRRQLEAQRTTGTRLVALDAALLFETGWSQLCDGVVFVDVPREIRLARAMARGWTAEQFAAREASQWPLDDKRQRSTWVLDNRRTPQDLHAQVQKLWDDLQPRMSTDD